MRATYVDGATRALGNGHFIRDEWFPVGTGKAPSMVTAWLPTPAELAALNAGAPVEVRTFGSEPAPMMVATGAVPELLTVLVQR